ncbi:MAG: hypothetical protein LBQ00_09720 [Syntrophobacterales bacterium]|jgi:hypothetical protein|nr:hypothetical protein [Syntrophobacterales bacterium]
MNKKAKKRAFFVCTAIFVMYVMAGLGFTERMSMKRIAAGKKITPNSMAMVIPATRYGYERSTLKASAVPSAPVVTEPAQGVPDQKEANVAILPKNPLQKPSAEVLEGSLHSEGTIEPSLFIAVPIVTYAIKEGWLDKDGLIFIKKDGYNGSSWKKPLDILKDKDQEGLRSVSKTIGKKQIYGFLGKEGIIHVQDDGIDDVILGKGYGVEKKMLLGLYDRHVPADYEKLFPFCVGGVSVVYGKSGFAFVKTAGVAKEQRDRESNEWLMPNLSNLTIKDAIEKLSAKTSKIKVYGGGNVTNQEPKPFQRVSGETECIIYGRVSR